MMSNCRQKEKFSAMTPQLKATTRELVTEVFVESNEKHSLKYASQLTNSLKIPQRKYSIQKQINADILPRISNTNKYMQNLIQTLSAFWSENLMQKNQCIMSYFALKVLMLRCHDLLFSLCYVVLQVCQNERGKEMHKNCHFLDE